MALPIALYARVSTNDQHVEAQLTELRAYAERRGVEVVEFVDSGVSGRKDKRPALDALMKAAVAHEISGVVIVRLDRLARSVLHLARLGEQFSELGIELVSLRESIDTSTTMGRAMFSMCGIFAELEADLIRERTVAGIAAARKRGSIIGRPPSLTAAQRRRVVRLHSSGKSMRKIAAQLGCGLGTVQRTLQASSS